MGCQMFLNVIYFRHLEILHRSSFLPFLYFSQPLGNFFLTVKAIFNWNFQSIATPTVQPFVAEYLRKECGDLNKVASDNDNVKDDDDDDDDNDDDSNSKNVEVVKTGTAETLTMLDRLVNLKYLSKERRNSLVTMKFKLAKIKVLSKKQSHISDYFKLEQSLHYRFY